MASASWRAPRTGNRALYWALYALAFAVMAAPLAWDLGWGQTHGSFAREAANVDEGRWAWRFLLLALAIRPAAQILRMPALLRYRRLIGLFAFAYTFVHSLDYLVYAHAWAIPYRVWKRRLYLWVGIVATLWTIPLAVTSWDRLRRRMGPVAWRKLHAGTYAIGVLVAVHALWEASTDYSQSIVCTAILAVLLVARLPWGQRRIAMIQPPRTAPVSGNTSRLVS